MDNEMSFESLYMKGFGVESWENTRDTSTESYITDGFEDGPSIELTHATEALNFIDAYSNIERKIASDKIRMCKKLAVTYGMKSGVNSTAAKSIESLCRIQSLEAAEAAEEAGADTKVSDSDKPKFDFKADREKNGFWKAVWHAIVNAFKAIGRFFKETVWGGIKKFFASFKKPDKDLTQEEQTAAKEKILAKADKAAASGSSDSKSKYATDSIPFPAGKFVITEGTVDWKLIIKDFEDYETNILVPVNKFITNNKPLSDAEKNNLKSTIDKIRNTADSINKSLKDANGNAKSTGDLFGIKYAIAKKENIDKAIKWASQVSNLKKIDISKSDEVMKTIDKFVNKAAKYAETLEKQYDSFDFSKSKGPKNLQPVKDSSGQTIDFKEVIGTDEKAWKVTEGKLVSSALRDLHKALVDKTKKIKILMDMFKNSIWIYHTGRGKKADERAGAKYYNYQHAKGSIPEKMDKAIKKPVTQ